MEGERGGREGGRGRETSSRVNSSGVLHSPFTSVLAVNHGVVVLD